MIRNPDVAKNTSTAKNPPWIHAKPAWYSMITITDIFAGVGGSTSGAIMVHEWLGSCRDRVKLAGNAVCPPAARDLVGAVVDALT